MNPLDFWEWFEPYLEDEEVQYVLPLFSELT